MGRYLLKQEKIIFRIVFETSCLEQIYLSDSTTCLKMAQTFGNIGLQGSSVGTFALKQNGLEWRDRNNVATEWASADVKKLSWNMYGSRGYLKVEMVSGDWTRMDGFARYVLENNLYWIIRYRVSSRHWCKLSLRRQM